MMGMYELLVWIIVGYLFIRDGLILPVELRGIKCQLQALWSQRVGNAS